MKHLNKRATRVMGVLTRQLTQFGQSQVLDNAPGAFMAVHVEFVAAKEAGPIFSVAHYYEQEGDLMRDPDMEFLRGADGKYYPISFWQDGAPTVRHEAVEWVGDNIRRYRPQMQADLVAFANQWLANIKQQQGIDTNVVSAQVQDRPTTETCPPARLEGRCEEKQECSTPE